MEQSTSTSGNNGLPYLPYEIFLLVAEAFLDAAEASTVPFDWFLEYDDSTSKICVQTHRLAYDPGSIKAFKQSQMERFLSFQPIYQVDHCVRKMALKTFFFFPSTQALPLSNVWICPRVDRLHLTTDNPWSYRGFLRAKRLQVEPHNLGGIRDMENVYLGGICTYPEVSAKRLKWAITMLPKLKTAWFTSPLSIRDHQLGIRLSFFESVSFWSPIPGEISLTGEALSKVNLTANLLQSKGVQVLVEFKGQPPDEPAIELALTDGRLHARFTDADCSISNPILKALRHSGRSLLYPNWKRRRSPRTYSSSSDISSIF